MKAIYIAVLCTALYAFGQEGAPLPAQQGYASQCGYVSQPQPQTKPCVAVPLFVNKTDGHVTRVAPGVYKEKQLNNKGDVILLKNIEFAPGEWKLPDVAAEVATDATTAALIESRRWRILTRSTPALRSLDAEKLFQGTGSQIEATQAFRALQQADATYLLLGRINRFRVDETKGVAYGVRRWQVVTSVSMDLQLLDVKTGEIIAIRPMNERLVMSIPEGVTSMTGMYDWEEALRAAVNSAVPKFLASVQSTPTADIVQTNAPMVSFEVCSTPERASVLFNGNFVGTTPCQISVPAALGVLSIIQPGYEPWEMRLVPNPSMKINPVLREKTQAPANNGTPVGNTQPLSPSTPQNGVPQPGAVTPQM